VLAGCGHGEPFQAPDPWAVGPLVPGTVARLTYSTGRDRSAAWRADGSGILYAWEDVATPLRGWCLGVLPAAGGNRTQSRCGSQVPDTVEAWDDPAESGDGRLAYVRAKSQRNAYAPYSWALAVGRITDPRAADSILPIPMTPPSGPPIQAIGQVRWLDDATLVILGQRLFIGQRCRGCPVDTTATGRMLYILPAAGGSPVPLPGTEYASGVAVLGPDELLFTRGGDGHVYRLQPSTGTVTPFLDLSAGGIARDVSVGGGRVAAVVGGIVSWGLDPFVGDSTQADEGGLLVIAEVTGAAVQVVDPGFMIRRPELAPDGRSAVVVTANHPEDLYLVGLP